LNPGRVESPPFPGRSRNICFSHPFFLDFLLYVYMHIILITLMEVFYVAV